MEIRSPMADLGKHQVRYIWDGMRRLGNHQHIPQAAWLQGEPGWRTINTVENSGSGAILPICDTAVSGKSPLQSFGNTVRASRMLN